MSATTGSSSGNPIRTVIVTGDAAGFAQRISGKRH